MRFIIDRSVAMQDCPSLSTSKGVWCILTRITCYPFLRGNQINDRITISLIWFVMRNASRPFQHAVRSSFVFKQMVACSLFNYISKRFSICSNYLRRLYKGIITIQLIPSHTDIPGSDKADTLTKESRTSPLLL